MVKNEEYVIWYAIMSVVDFVDQIIVFDNGSTDRTAEIVIELAQKYPKKIIYERKDACDKAAHTARRNEMIARTTTDWFMILDGDEVWTKQAIKEAKTMIEAQPTLNCLIAPFYLCVGDVCHSSRRGQYMIRGQRLHATPRFFRKQPGVQWAGTYNHDAVTDQTGAKIFEGGAVEFLSHRFWHLTHLLRSSVDADTFTSGGVRATKRIATYWCIGDRIQESLPEVFDDTFRRQYHLTSYQAVHGFFWYVFHRLT